MPRARTTARCLVALCVLLAWPLTSLGAEASGFGDVAVPQPAKPVGANACVEPVEIMRREHMKLLDHQRDVTVIDGERDGKYSLVGCMNCHNPARADGKIVRYEDPEHFCADCHRYTSVKIDCFECHADRGLAEVVQGRLDSHATAGLTASTFNQRLGKRHVD